jgi:polysaccharide pyruvyl transferase WcaK-like protein
MAINRSADRDRRELEDSKAIELQKEVLSKTLSRVRIRPESKEGSRTFSFLGHFGLGNFGNEITLQAILYHLRRLLPNVEVNCICTGPAATAKIHNIVGLPISRTVVQGWRPRNRVARALRSVFIGVPSELYLWLEALMTLSRTDVVIVPGTGLLTDAFGLRSWGPYTIFKWSLIAKMRGCKLFFVSVGAGPIYSRVGRWLVTSTLALADFRSYRDNATKEYLSSIGAAVGTDRVFPDLAFSIVDEIAPKRAIPKRGRSIVGLGLMLYHGKLSSDKQPESTYTTYLEQLLLFAKWLLARDYDIRLLIGEVSDTSVTTEFKALLKDYLGGDYEDRIIDDPVLSVGDLLTQLVETDAVVATRFHNVLLALALNKPVISISPHQKCTSLMENMGLQEYCQDIQHLSADKLIEQFCQLEKNGGSLRCMIREKVADRRKALDEQYRLIFKDLLLE